MSSTAYLVTFWTQLIHAACWQQELYQSNLIAWLIIGLFPWYYFYNLVLLKIDYHYELDAVWSQNMVFTIWMYWPKKLYMVYGHKVIM